MYLQVFSRQFLPPYCYFNYIVKMSIQVKGVKRKDGKEGIISERRRAGISGRLSCKQGETQADVSIDDEKNDGKEAVKGTAVGVLLILLVMLMTCIFSTLDNAVTLVHSSGTMDSGQWPRILLALSGLAAGFVFDIKNRKYMGLVMYCVMVLSTICIAVLKFARPFSVGLIVFYLSAGFFAVFFTSGFMEIARHMKMPALWAGM